MLEAYRSQRWEEAMLSLEECRKIPLPGADLAALYEVYAARIRTFMKTPPAATWDGVTTAESK